MPPNPLHSLADCGRDLLGRLRLPFGNRQRHADSAAQSLAEASDPTAVFDADSRPASAGVTQLAASLALAKEPAKRERDSTGAQAADPPSISLTASAAAPPHLHLSHPVDREELGRATWVLLHTLAAQFPDRPTKQQRKDAATLVDVLTRIYPCSDCAAHFREVVRKSPVEAASGPALQQWLCQAHNAVNRSLDKPVFNCSLVGARWRSLDCDDGQVVCSLSPVPGRRAS